MTNKSDELINSLRKKGYKVSLAHGGIYDLDFNGIWLILSGGEAMALNKLKANHPVNVFDYSTDNGRNFNFTNEVEK